MKIRTLYKLGGLFLAIIAISSCVDKPTYPSEPVIVYKDFIRYGNSANPDSVELVVSFTDNEGDIGYDQADVIGVFGNSSDSLKYGNFWMIYLYEDTSGNFVPYDLDLSTSPIDTLKYYYRVPLVLPDGDPDEPVKGLIFAKSKRGGIPPSKPPIFPDKKIMFKVYMYDQAKHKSNIVESLPIEF